ncbi:MAG: hypothetical protein JXR25_03415 [Pontiellaceae bacterium]|nr:hypothetical protein [Pontiellaceae bacterium]MBN2783852.1 hypothetical protein [Pontiellaceae bacterium]
MKNNIGYIFVDDGYPEAEEYETNYIRCDNATNGNTTGRLSDSLSFRSIPIDTFNEQRLPRSYRRRRLPMGISRIRLSLQHLLHN